MKNSSRLFLVSSLLMMAGCGGAPGATGPAGANGADGAAGSTSKFASSFVCAATISGTISTQSTTARKVSYTAEVMSSGDVISTANVQSTSLTIGNTNFYASSQSGATTASVTFVDAFATANSASWTISLDRTTLIMTAVYTDAGLNSGNPITMTFPASACTKTTF